MMFVGVSEGLKELPHRVPWVPGDVPRVLEDVSASAVFLRRFHGALKSPQGLLAVSEVMLEVRGTVVMVTCSLIYLELWFRTNCRPLCFNRQVTANQRAGFWCGAFLQLQCVSVTPTDSKVIFNYVCVCLCRSATAAMLQGWSHVMSAMEMDM